MYVCICHAVTTHDVVELINDGAQTPQDVSEACGAGTGCGSCLDRVCAILRNVPSGHAAPLARAG